MATQKRKGCPFCKKKITAIDYKDPALLVRYFAMWSKMKPAKSTGACAKHQRRLSQAIKRARYLALVPYTTR